MPATNELASIWNNPEFTKQLIGSYGFASDVEPRLKPEEQAIYRDKYHLMGDYDTMTTSFLMDTALYYLVAVHPLDLALPAPAAARDRG